MSDCLEKLINSSDTSPEKEAAVEEINELQEKKTEIFHGRTRKFTVVNYQDRYGKSGSVDTCDLSKTDTEFNVVNEKLVLNYSETKFDDVSNSFPNEQHGLAYEEEYNEGDDAFDSILINKNDFHTIHAKYRESEGQDTITSLSNHHFLKKLDRNRKMPRSLATSTKDLNQEFADVTTPVYSVAQSMNTDLNVLNDSTSSFRALPLSDMRSLFARKLNNSNSNCSTLTYRTSQTSIYNELKRNQLLEFIKSDTQSIMTAQNSMNNEAYLGEPIMIEAGKADSVEVGQNSKSDQVFQVLKDAIDSNDSSFLERDFINEVINTLKYQQRKERKHRDNVRKIFRFFELLVFFLITIMTMFLVYNVFYKLKTIHDVGSRSVSYRFKVNVGKQATSNASLELINI